MSRYEKTIMVTAICLSIVIAGALIAYRPWAPEEIPALETGMGWLPTGLGVSQGQLFAPTVQQGSYPEAYTISLKGYGSSSAKADLAKVTLGVENSASEASVAISSNAETMSQVIEAIKAAGIPDEDMVTVGYSVYPRYDWTDSGRVFRGYVVSNMVQVTVRDLEKVGVVIDTASDAGANQIQGISFELSDSKKEELKAQAYVAALTDARDKAEVVAETLGLTITGVRSVAEYSYTPVRTYDYVEELGAEYGVRSTTPIISGELSVSVSVSVVFEFE